MSTDLQPLSLSYALDDSSRPRVSLGDISVASVDELAAKLPALLEPERLSEYCQALNFLTSGYRYHVIDDADAFRKNYEERYVSEAEQDNGEDGVVRLPDFGLFDTTEIHAPQTEGDAVVFYVEDDAFGTPSRVTAPDPASAMKGIGSFNVVYEPLPLAKL